jgi:dihydrofolate reductase
MIISTIVAVAKNGVIGHEQQIPWYLPADLKYFKQKTLNHWIIMGRKCFESIGRPLPKRTNVVITRNPFFVGTGVLTVHSIQEALHKARLQGEKEVFIIGGGEIYRQTQSFWDKIYLTEVDIEPEGEVFFPKIIEKEWKTTFQETHEPDDKNEFRYTFKILERNDE